MSSRSTLIDLECCIKTLRGVLQTVQFQKNVSQVYERCDVIRLQGADELITSDSVFETTLVLIQFCEEIDPAEVFGREAAGIHVTLSRWRVERISMVDLAQRAVGFAQGCRRCCGIF